MRMPRRSKAASRADAPVPPAPGLGAQDDGEDRTGAAALLVEASVPETDPPPLTRDLVQSVRFNIAEPQGYFFPQVEEFVEQTRQTLAYFEEQVFQYQRLVHRLQTELGLQVHDVLSLRQQIEIFKVQGSPLTNADGSYRTESQEAGSAQVLALQEQVEAHAQQVQDRHAAESQGHQVLAQSAAQVQAWVDYSAAQDQQIAALRAWGEGLASQVAAASAPQPPSPDLDLDVLGEGTGEDQTPGAEGGDEVRDLAAAGETADVDSWPTGTDLDPGDATPTAQVVPQQGGDHAQPDGTLPVQYHEAPQHAGPPEHSEVPQQPGVSQWTDAQGAYAAPASPALAAGEGTDGYVQVPAQGGDQRPLPVAPVDSELPASAYVTSAAAPTYAAIRPGDPLRSAAGVPLETWAPELHEHHR